MQLLSQSLMVFTGSQWQCSTQTLGSLVFVPCTHLNRTAHARALHVALLGPAQGHRPCHGRYAVCLVLVQYSIYRRMRTCARALTKREFSVYQCVRGVQTRRLHTGRCACNGDDFWGGHGPPGPPGFYAYEYYITY